MKNRGLNTTIVLEKENPQINNPNKYNGEALDHPLISAPNTITKKLYLESYGCQMNFSDSEIVASILNEQGFITTKNFQESDLILLNTCSIREKAEITVRTRLKSFNKLKRKNPKLPRE